jgi:hypothetical protein
MNGNREGVTIRCCKNCRIKMATSKTISTSVENSNPEPEFWIILKSLPKTQEQEDEELWAKIEDLIKELRKMRNLNNGNR